MTIPPKTDPLYAVHRDAARYHAVRTALQCVPVKDLPDDLRVALMDDYGLGMRDHADADHLDYVVDEMLMPPGW